MAVTMELTEQDEYALIRDICKDSLWDFVQEFWNTITNEPLIPNWHMPVLCYNFQKVVERVIAGKKKQHDLLINVPPGTSKSTIISIMGPAWAWTKAPWLQFICCSYAEALSDDLANKCRDVVNSEKYRKCFPGVEIRADQAAKRYFQLTKKGWRYSCGVGGSVTGKHGHIIIIDDPVDPKEALSVADNKAAADWLTNTISTRKVSHEKTVSIMIMQRLAENDPSWLWLDWAKKGMPLEHICLPAELTDDVKPARLRKMYVDGLFDVRRFTRKVLDAHKLKGVLAYNSQFLQRPIPPGGGLFKTGKITIENIAFRHLPPGWRLCRYWDKASTPEGGAYTVGALLGRAPDGVFWVLDIVRGQWEPSERERTIRQVAEMDGRKVMILVEQEPGSGGKDSVLATIRNLAGFRAKEDLARGDKMLRADPFAAQVNAGNVYVRKADWNEDYLQEMRLFSPIATYKDQVDASAGAFNFLAGRRIKIGAF
jgi:predicted phage terminase large subunit-like protein